MYTSTVCSPVLLTVNLARLPPAVVPDQAQPLVTGSSILALEVTALPLNPTWAVLSLPRQKPLSQTKWVPVFLKLTLNCRYGLLET